MEQVANPSQVADIPSTVENPSSVCDTSPARARPCRRAGQPGCDTSWHEAFIHALEEFADVKAAADVVGVHRATPYRHKAHYAEFSERWDAAVEIKRQYIEDVFSNVLMARALDGSPKPVFHMGEKVGEVVEYDNKLGMWWLGKLNPEKYGDRKVIEQQGGVTVTHQEGEGKLSAEQMSARHAQAFPGMFAEVLPREPGGVPALPSSEEVDASIVEAEFARVKVPEDEEDPNPPRDPSDDFPFPGVE